MTAPSGCAHCGIEAREHMQRWHAQAGWHQWVAPTQEQIKARMLTRRAERLASPAAPVFDGELTGASVYVELTIHTGPMVRAFQRVESAIVFGFHPDLRTLDTEFDNTFPGLGDDGSDGL